MSVTARTGSTQHGFSLVELLVAMTIMALVAALLGNSIRFSADATIAIEAGVYRAESIHLMYRALSRQFRHARPVVAVDPDGGRTVEFEASQRRVSFIAVPPEMLGVRALHRIRIEIENDPDINGSNGRIVISYEPYRRGASFIRVSADGSFRILDGFGRAEFAYFDAQRRPSGQWHDEWLYTDRLPDLVRLRIFGTDAASRDPVDLIMTTPAHAVVRDVGV